MGVASQYATELLSPQRRRRWGPLGVVTGMARTPGGLPPMLLGLRLLLRSPANAAAIDEHNVVGVAKPWLDSVASVAGGTQITLNDLGLETPDYRQDHRLVMTSGNQRGLFRPVVASSGPVLTVDRAFPSDPLAGDECHMIPLRVPEQAWRGHDANAFYYYAVQEISGLGVRGPRSEPVRVEFDGAVAIRGPSANAVRFVSVAPIAGGKFRVTWLYVPGGQGAFPADFQVFDDAGTGTIDYNTPLTDSRTGLDSLNFRLNQQVYSFTTGAYGDGAERLFGVRARNTSGLAQLGPQAAPDSATAAATGPPAISQIHQVQGVAQ